MSATDPIAPFDRLSMWAGAAPPTDTLPDPYPYETATPDVQGWATRDGVRTWYAVYGTQGPWLVIAQLNQIGHASAHKAIVPYLSCHYRVLVTDPRGNGRSDRPEAPEAYSFDHLYEDFVAVLDAAGVDRAAVFAISASTLPAIRLAAEHPERVSHLVVVGGFAESMVTGTPNGPRIEKINQRIESDWSGYVDWFWSLVCTEPHSTKPFEDGVPYSNGTHPHIHRLTRACCWR